MRVQSSSKLSFPLESLIKITIARSNNIPSIHRRPIIPRPDPSIKIGDQVRFPWFSRHESRKISQILAGDRDDDLGTRKRAATRISPLNLASWALRHCRLRHPETLVDTLIVRPFDSGRNTPRYHGNNTRTRTRVAASSRVDSVTDGITLDSLGNKLVLVPFRSRTSRFGYALHGEPVARA